MISRIRRIRANYSARTALEDAVSSSHLRLKFGSLVFLLAFAIIAARLVELTAFADGNASHRVSQRPAEVRKSRIEITDRNGEVIATNLKMLSLFANPAKVKDAEKIAEKITQILPDLSKEEVLKKLKGKGQFAWIKREITPAEAKKINMLGEPSLGFKENETRIYPYGNMFAHVLGYVDVDSHGIAGMEKTLDDMEKRNAQMPERIALSVDVRVQGVVHDEMKKVMEQFSAIGAVGMVADVNTGEILSMVSMPDFNPHKPAEITSDAKFNRASLGVYEMGSTFKALTTAMALDSGKVSIGGGFDASDPIKYSRFTITDYHAKNRYLTVPEIFMYSSNIGTAKMALEVGGAAQKEFLKKMGVMSPINIGLPEKGRPLTPTTWNDLTTMTVAYGHGIAVTPTHMAQTVATLVNGGIMRPLTIIKGSNDENDGVQVIKPQTSKIMRKLLRLVVEKGTGTKGEADGYFVGGKTGTAEKVVGGRYNHHALMSSFISAFPINNPKYMVMVILDEPKPTKESMGFATAGWTAAPAASRIVERIAPILGVMPVGAVDDQNKSRMAGNFTGDLKLASY